MKCGARSSEERGGAKIEIDAGDLPRAGQCGGSVCGPQPQRLHISTLSLNFKGEECDVCTSVYQPLVPSIFRLGLMSAPQYDDKALDTVYYFIHQACTRFTCSTFHVSFF